MKTRDWRKFGSMNLLEKPTYHTGDVEIDPSRRLVKRNGQEFHLQLQTFQVLIYLIEHRHRFVTKDELIENIWQVSAVTDNALVQCIMDIRKALGDAPRQPRFVKTLPKLGYHFIAEVEERRPKAPEAQPDATTAREPKATPHLSQSDDKPAVSAVSIPGLFASSRPRLVLASAILILIALVAGFAWKFGRSTGPQVDVVIPVTEGKRTLAVMYFHNQSGAEDFDWMREGLADMFITDLSRASRLAVLSRQQLQLLLERVGHRGSDDIGLDVALDVARRSRAEVILMGNFAKVGDKIRIDAQLHNAHNGQLLAAERLVVDNQDQLLTQIDLLSLKLASHLGASPAENEKVDLAGAMTHNLEAYRYYSLAVEKAQGFHNAEAIEFLEKAVRLDPQFAMAHARLGYAYAVTWGLGDKGKPYLEKAFKLFDRLTEKDKLNIRAWYALANRDYQTAIGMFRKIIAEYPTDVEAYWRLGRLLEGEERLDEALEVSKQGLVIDPDAKELYNLSGMIYTELARHDEAIAAHQRYLALAPNEANAYDSLGLSYQAAGRYAEAIDAYNRALALAPEFEIALVHLGNAYFQQGRYREAIEQYRRYIQIGPSGLERARGNSCITYVYLRKGAARLAEQAAKQVITYEQLGVWNRLMIAFDRGEKAMAAQLEKELFGDIPGSNRGSTPPPRISYYFRGYLDLKKGHFPEAIENFKETLRYRPPFWHIDSFEDCLANGYLEMGRPDDAIAEYQRILRLNPNYPLAHYHLAQAYERKGDNAQARSNYFKFLEAWKQADADIPEVVAAKKALENASQ